MGTIIRSPRVLLLLLLQKARVAAFIYEHKGLVIIEHRLSVSPHWYPHTSQAVHLINILVR